MSPTTRICPNCQHPHQLCLPTVTAISCQFCHHLIIWGGDDVVEQKPIPACSAISQSELRVGQTGALKGLAFTVVTHLICYDVTEDPYEDFWEEWVLMFADDTIGYLEHEEGIYGLSTQKIRVTSTVPAFENLQVGAPLVVEHMTTTILEKGTAQVFAAAGQHLVGETVSGAFFQYVELSFHHYLITLEYFNGEALFFYGVPLNPDQLKFTS